MKRRLQQSATLGGIAWLVFVAWPHNPNLGIGIIEKLFLLGPLVTVPLGLVLAFNSGTTAERWAAWMQPVGAAGLIISYLFPQGRTAGMLVVPWLGMIALVAWVGFRRFGRSLALPSLRTPRELCFIAAMLLLAVGGIGLMQSRLGMSPLGFREPLVLLVAVHFHFAAFVAPIVAGAAMRESATEDRWPNWVIATLVSAGSPVLAAGYVSSVRGVKLTGAMMLVAGLVATSFIIARQIPMIRPRLAQVLLAVAALSVWVAMAYASVYAVADYCGEVWVAIPQMARTHGVINALGFSLGGLAGWNVANGENTQT